MRFLKAIMLSSILSVFAMSCSNGHSVIQTDYNQCKVKCVNLDFLCSYSLRGTAPLFNIPLVEVIQVEVAADTVLHQVEEAVLQVVEVAEAVTKFLEISNDY